MCPSTPSPAGPAHTGTRRLPLALRRALTSIPRRQRLVCYLHDVRGLTHAEIAARLGIAAGTSKRTLSMPAATCAGRSDEGSAGSAARCGRGARDTVPIRGCHRRSISLIVAAWT